MTGLGAGIMLDATIVRSLLVPTARVARPVKLDARRAGANPASAVRPDGTERTCMTPAPLNHWETNTMTDMLRASDAERDVAGEELRRHHADGRIDTDELQERIHRCYSAKTRGELDQLLADLPREPDAGERSPADQSRRWWLVAAVSLLTLFLAAGSGHNHQGLGIVPLLVVAFVACRIVRRRTWW